MSVQDVQQQIDEAKEGKQPPIEDLWNNIYVDPLVSPLLCRWFLLICNRHLQSPQQSLPLPEATCAEEDDLF